MTRTQIIKPGETFILPQGATVTALVLDGAISVDSSCNNLPDPSSYKCGMFQLVADNDDNDAHPMDEEHLRLMYLYVAGTTYNLGGIHVLVGDNPGSINADHVTLNTFVPDQALFSFTNVTRDTSPDKRQYIYIYFKVVETLYDEVSMQIENWESLMYVKPDEADIDCDSYPFPG